MAQKKVWITWIASEDSQVNPESVGTPLANNGLMVHGAPWVDDLPKFAWKELADVLLDNAKVDVWLIACDAKSLDNADNRYALSMIFALLSVNREPDFPVCLLGLDFTPDYDNLPTLLRGTKPVNMADPAWAAGVVAYSVMKQKPPVLDYRFTLRADMTFGQWFEVGPAIGEWKGIMLGVSDDCSISHHAVGPSGVLPERAVVEYPIQDMKVSIGETNYVAWAVQNTLDKDTSYFVKVNGNPQKVIFGGHPGEDDAEVFVITMK